MANPNVAEIRHMRSGSLNIQGPGNGQSNSMMSPMATVSRFDGPRSPPSKSDPGVAGSSNLVSFSSPRYLCRHGPC